jgi:hypothetical protein
MSIFSRTAGILKLQLTPLPLRNAFFLFLSTTLQLPKFDSFVFFNAFIFVLIFKGLLIDVNLEKVTNNQIILRAFW